MSKADYKTIYNQDPEIGPALTPLLEQFDTFFNIDPMLYGLIARALLDAYGKGQKNGMRTAREVSLSVFKGPTTEELLRNGRAK